jgi:hypothetical protein
MPFMVSPYVKGTLISSNTAGTRAHPEAIVGKVTRSIFFSSSSAKLSELISALACAIQQEGDITVEVQSLRVIER